MIDVYAYRKLRKSIFAVVAIAATATCAWTSAAAAGDDTRTRTLSFDLSEGKWIEQAPPPPGTPEGDLHTIRRLIHRESFSKAERALTEFEKSHGSAGELAPQVLIVKAQVLFGVKKYEKAQEVLQRFLSEYGGMSLTNEALRLQFVMAELYLSGLKRKLLGLPLLSGIEFAYTTLDQLSFDYPETDVAIAAIKTKADHMFQEGDHALAELEYARLVKEYPQSRYHQYALRRTAESALASYRGVEYDDAALVEAEERYAEYRTQYPSNADNEGVGLVLSTIQEMRAEKEYAIAQFYERTDHLASAVFYYENVLSDWPGTVAANKAQARLALLGLPGDEQSGTH